MGIFSRLSDIINSNLNAMLDKAEDPNKMIRLIIAEMEETLVEVRSSCARIIADKKTVTRRLERLQAEAKTWEDKACLAISKSRDDLARAAIAEKTSIEEEIATVEAELVSLDENLDTLNHEVAQLQQKLDDAKAKRQALLLRAQTVENRHKVQQQISKRSTDEAFNKFEAFQRKLDDLEGQVEAYDIGKNDLASEIDQLAKDDAINDELERLKAQMKDKV